MSHSHTFPRAMALSAKQSGKLIAKLAEHVKIKPDGIEKLGKQVRLTTYITSRNIRNSKI